MTAYLLLTTAGAIGVARSANPTGGDKARGAEVFNQWCAPCHAPGPYHPGTQALEAKYLGKLPGALEERRDLTRGVVKTFVRQGVSIMPFFRKTEITDGDLESLSAYLSKK
jgi:(+)-pinoresinol hydroxylase